MAYFAKFTERGQRALLAAQSEAAQLGRTYVGTEHLLLGVLTEPGGAVGVLKGIVGVILVLGTHVTSKKLTGRGVW